MHFDRSSGVLLHVTSLPSRFGIGDFGPEATEWIDWLASAGCRYWQILPLGPTGYGDSPYASPSSFAGNPLLVSPELLVTDGLVSQDEIVGGPGADDVVDYTAVTPWKLQLLDTARERLEGDLHTEFVAFRNDESAWLDDFSLFMALKELHGSGSWVDWPTPLRHRDLDALNDARHTHAAEVERHAFRQFIFYRQWSALRSYAASRGVSIIGDIPLYTAHDSSDIWAQPELFAIDPETNEATHVGGVPPDMFSEFGQRWGNPLYRWEEHAKDGYAWWVERLRAAFRQVDVLRIDHFTGFAKYFAIDADEPTAEHGAWLDGPGVALFDAVSEALGDAPIIAEDLGPLNGPVEALRAALGFPGMKVLQEGFDGDPANMFHPDNYAEDFVVYTGTHDSDTSIGRFHSGDDDYRRRVLTYTGDTSETYPRGLVEAAWRSRAVIAIAPMQDLLGLDTSARMNYPSTIGGNWEWRMAPGSATPEVAAWLAALNEATGRNA